MIEEDALNEKSCIQVLKILIAKEDKEIEELEKDLSSLQSELAFIERPEFHIHDLTQRIEKLKSSSISKDECADKSRVNSLSSSHQTLVLFSLSLYGIYTLANHFSHLMTLTFVHKLCSQKRQL